MKIVRSCPYCGMDQTSRGGLRQHISRKHREEHKLAKAKSSASGSTGRMRSAAEIAAFTAVEISPILPSPSLLGPNRTISPKLESPDGANLLQD